MRLLIDIGHPAHVHYFKNFTWKMKEMGHEVFFVARDKEMTFELLNQFGFEFESRGTGGKGLIGKALYLLKGGWLVYKAARVCKPDMLLSFASSYAAHASFLYGVPHIALDDTEHSKLELLLYPPFTNYIITPDCFQLDLGSKHVRFNGFMEQLYLHPNYYTPNPKVLSLLGIGGNESFAIVRFVSWGASHDAGIKRFTPAEKIKVVEMLAEKMKVFISAEDELPDELKPFQLSIPKQMIHDALYYAGIYVGEGATTATEAALLGTPSVYLNMLSAGTIDREVEVGMLKQCITFIEAKQAIDWFLHKDKEELVNVHKELVADTIDPTLFLVDFVSSRFGLN